MCNLAICSIFIDEFDGIELTGDLRKDFVGQSQ